MPVCDAVAVRDTADTQQVGQVEPQHIRQACRLHGGLYSCGVAAAHRPHAGVYQQLILLEPFVGIYNTCSSAAGCNST